MLATLEGTAPPPRAPGEPVAFVNANPVNVAFSPDGQVIASTDGTSAVRVWDAATGKRLRVLGGEGMGVTHSLAFSPDGRRLALGGGASVDDPRLRVWEADTGREVLSLAGHKRFVSAVTRCRPG